MAWTFYNSSGETLTNFGPVALTDLDIDGGTDIGAAIVDADLFIIDDGAGGTNRKTAASRIKTYIGSAGVTREGGNATEATTTSTSPVDLLSATSLTIAASEPFYFVCSGRKTTGAASAVGLGLKLNSTVVGEANAGSTNRGWASDSTNQAEDGGYFIHFQPRVTNYVNGTVGRGHVSSSSGGDTGTTTSAGAITTTATLPTAEITAVVIRGDSATSITLGADELQVYSLATS
jgi:hypothetical protein